MKKIRATLIFVFGLLILAFLGFFLLGKTQPAAQVACGVTYSAKSMRSYHLDPQKAFLEILDDLKVRKFRLIAFWDVIEKEKDVYDFSELDWQIAEASQREATIILAMGQKVPRWPECHLPPWALALAPDQRNQESLELIALLVKRYQDNPQIIIWQIENEPFFFRSFGDCTQYQSKILDQEIALVRSLDPRPIMVTSSGEMSLWIGEFRRADIFGTSLYKYVYNRIFGYMQYRFPAIYFQRKVLLMRLLFGPKKVIVSELQGEPWVNADLKTASPELIAKTMSPEKFQKILAFSQKCGFDDVYLWGVEWWYWQKAQGDETYWELAKKLFVF